MYDVLFIVIPCTLLISLILFLIVTFIEKNIKLSRAYKRNNIYIYN